MVVMTEKKTAPPVKVTKPTYCEGGGKCGKGAKCKMGPGGWRHCGSGWKPEMKPCHEYNCAANHEGFCAKDDVELYAMGTVSDPNMKCPTDNEEE